jgi:hypothetical protein
MPDTIGKIAPILGIGAAGSGLFGNIMNAITRGKAVGSLEKAEKKFTDLTPEQLSGLVSRAEQPLGQDLTQSVGNLVQADVAGRGLAESPGVFAATEAQALAPYKLQQQQMALQLVLKQLGLPIEYAEAILGATGQNADVSKLLAMVMNAQKGGSGGGSGGGLTEADIAQLSATLGMPTGTPPIVDVGTGTGGGVD